MSNLFDRYNPLVATVFEIVRAGKKGSTKTSYTPFAIETTDTHIEDLPEVPHPLGTIILDKTYDELAFYADNGYFEEEPGEAPPVRRGANNSRQSEPAVRRAPANQQAPAGRRRFDTGNGNNKF